MKFAPKRYRIDIFSTTLVLTGVVLPTSPDLSPQQVEVLRTGGRVGDLEIYVFAVRPHLAGVSHLEETLQATRTVLWAHAVVAMGQQECQPGALHPLGWKKHSHDSILSGAQQKKEERKFKY